MLPRNQPLANIVSLYTYFALRGDQDITRLGEAGVRFTERKASVLTQRKVEEGFILMHECKLAPTFTFLIKELWLN